MASTGGPIGQYREKADGYFAFPKLEGELGPHMKFNGQEVLCWSLNTVLRLFNDPHFPASDFGKTKVVEAHALINYFSKRHERETEKYWTEGGKTC